MAKMVDIEKLKGLLEGAINEDKETAFIEGLMGIAVDYDDTAVETRIAEASEKAKADAQAEYSKKLHDMFFGKLENANTDDSKVVTQNAEETPELEPLFTEVK